MSFSTPCLLTVGGFTIPTGRRERHNWLWAPRNRNEYDVAKALIFFFRMIEQNRLMSGLVRLAIVALFVDEYLARPARRTPKKWRNAIGKSLRHKSGLPRVSSFRPKGETVYLPRMSDNKSFALWLDLLPMHLWFTGAIIPRSTYTDHQGCQIRMPNRGWL